MVVQIIENQNPKDLNPLQAWLIPQEVSPPLKQPWDYLSPSLI